MGKAVSRLKIALSSVVFLFVVLFAGIFALLAIPLDGGVSANVLTGSGITATNTSGAGSGGSNGKYVATTSRGGILGFSSLTENTTIGISSNPVGTGYNLRNRGVENQNQGQALTYTNFNGERHDKNRINNSDGHFATLQVFIAITGDVKNAIDNDWVSNLTFDFYYGLGALVTSGTSGASRDVRAHSFFDLSTTQVTSLNVRGDHNATGNHASSKGNLFSGSRATAPGATSLDSYASCLGETVAIDGHANQNSWKWKQQTGINLFSNRTAIANNGGFWIKLYTNTRCYGSLTQQVYSETACVLEGVTMNLTLKTEANPSTPAGLSANFGQTLNSVPLPTDPSGTWAWTNGNQSVGNVGTNSFEAKFTPYDTTNYRETTRQIPVAVSQAYAGWAGDTVFSIGYGETFTLPAGLSYVGSAPDLTERGEYNARVLYTPFDTNYYSDELDITIFVTTALENYSGETEFDITFGDEFVLPAGLSWFGAEPTLDAGTVIARVQYTPEDENYHGNQFDITINVATALENYTGIKTFDTTYGDEFVLPAGLSWAEAEPTLDAGVVTARVKYTPANTNYHGDEFDITIFVATALQTYAGETILDITFGDAFTLPTGLSWVDGEPALNAGTIIEKVKYTPTNTSYHGYEFYITINVATALENYAGAKTFDITFGDTFTLPAGLSYVNGSPILNAGTIIATVEYIPTNTNYHGDEFDITINVAAALQTYLGVKTFDITYGSQFNLPAGLSYVNYAPILNAGTITARVLYTPVDTNYYGDEFDITINVATALENYAGAKTFNITFGDTFTLPAGLNYINGQPVLVAGVVKATVLYTPTNTNFHGDEFDITINVAQREVLWTGARTFDITFGDTFALPEGLTFVSGAPILNAGDGQTFAVVFTGANDANNFGEQFDITINVAKAESVYTYTNLYVQYGESWSLPNEKFVLIDPVELPATFTEDAYIITTNYTFSENHTTIVVVFTITVVNGMVDEIIGRINALPGLDNLVIADLAIIEAIIADYDELDGTRQEMVYNVNDLFTAYNKVLELVADELAASQVIAEIDGLPQVAALTLADKQTLLDVREIFDALTATQKQMVTNIAKLEALESKMLDLVADRQAADAVISKIAALPDTIALTDKNAVAAARQSYNQLTGTQKSLVNNFVKLQAAETRIDEIENDIALANQVVAIINNLPSADELTLADEVLLTGARDAYTTLTATQEAYVNNLAVLEALEAKLAELKNQINAAISAIETLPSVDEITLNDKDALQAVREFVDNLTDEQRAQIAPELLEQLAALESRMTALQDEGGAGMNTGVIVASVGSGVAVAGAAVVMLISKLKKRKKA